MIRFTQAAPPVFIATVCVVKTNMAWIYESYLVVHVIFYKEAANNISMNATKHMQKIINVQIWGLILQYIYCTLHVTCDSVWKKLCDMNGWWSVGVV